MANGRLRSTVAANGAIGEGFAVLRRAEEVAREDVQSEDLCARAVSARRCCGSRGVVGAELKEPILVYFKQSISTLFHYEM